MTVQTVDARLSLREILQIIRDDGCLIIENLATPAIIDRIAADLRGDFDGSEFGDGRFCGLRTKRLGGIARKSGVAVRLLAHPLILQVMEHILGPYCDRIQLNLSQAINIYPGETAQILHRDEGMFPAQGFAGELMANVIWALDDIGPENGSTQLVVGSHSWPKDRLPEENEIEQAVLRKGSALIYLGSLIHGGGANRSERERPVIVFGYNLGWLRQAEVQYLVFPPDIARFLPKAVQQLIGYAVHRPNCGLVDCEDPALLLGSSRRRRLASHDYLTDEQIDMLKDGKRTAA